MQVRNDYHECLTNLACSIRKYFGLSVKHNTLNFVDEYLKIYHPKNVVVILFDGMGTNILERSLPEDSFFRRNLKKSITTVFPATTTAVTTSLRTGLNPVEHGWLGWTMYIEPIQKIITLFTNSEKCSVDGTCEDFLKIKDRFTPKTIVEEINARGKFSATELMPFGSDAYLDLDEMLERIQLETKKPGRRYIYAYDSEPDGTMHRTGPDDDAVKHSLLERSEKVEKLASKLDDTLLIVLADHGHVKVRNLFLADYPDLLALLAGRTSIDQRAVVFKVKTGKKREFRRLFNHYFGQFYDLYSQKEVIDAQLFGDGPEHKFYRPALGDFLAIAKSDVCLVAPDDEILTSQHAGYTDDEIFVPIIIKHC